MDAGTALRRIVVGRRDRDGDERDRIGSPVGRGHRGLLLVVAGCTSSGAGAGAPSAASAVPGASAAAASPAASRSLPADRYGGGDDYSYGSSASPAAASSAGSGSDQSYEVTVDDSPDGKHLSGEGGMTLYIFKKDSANKSACTGDCATSWPPFTLDAGESTTAGAGLTGKLTTFARPDGSMQVAYDGAPLYYYSGDSDPGDDNGQGVGGILVHRQPLSWRSPGRRRLGAVPALEGRYTAVNAIRR